MLVACRATLYLPVDLYHAPTRTLIEIDEAPHFTSFRAAALGSYPASARVGYDVDAYRELCTEGAAQNDKFQKGLAAKGYGIGGVQRERAYRDSLVDLGAAAMGHPPLVRLVAQDSDGVAAYARNRDALMELLSVTR